MDGWGMETGRPDISSGCSDDTVAWRGRGGI